MLNSTGLRDDQMTVVFPRGALAIFILAWGFFSDHIAISIGLCMLVEGIKLQRLRWDLSAKHFQNIADFTTVLFAVVVVYQFIQYGFHGIYGILGLLPLCLFPLVFSQRLSNAESFPMSALFLSLRKKIARGAAKEQWVSTELIYALSCLLGASTGPLAGNTYFYMVVVCGALLLFLLRSQTAPLKLWFPSILMVVVLSIFFRTGMEFGYRQIESSMSYWFSQFKWTGADPNKARTAIGHIGRLKLSDRIVLRVKAPLSIPLPLYLHEASYNRFNLGSWHAPEQSPIAIDRLPNTVFYSLRSAPDIAPLTHADGDSQNNIENENQPRTKTRRIVITAKHSKDVSVQAFPIGSTGVESDEIIELKKNAMGTISLEAIPGQLRYHVDYLPRNHPVQGQRRAAPTPNDLEVPENYRKAFEHIVDELQLSALPPTTAMARVSEFFHDNFRYSLIGKGYYPGKKPLLHFLTKERSGHCEYFATATTLLLRTIGIPARYSVGYVVDEYSSLENAFVARARHAHAWTEVFVDGRWQVFDTTPSNWLALEEERISNWQSIQDYLGWVGLHINRLQRLDRADFNKRIIWFVPALLVWLMWRLRRKITVKEPTDNNELLNSGRPPNLALAQLLEALERRGIIPTHGQTVRKLLTEHCPPELNAASLKRLLSLYYQERFTDSALNKQEEQELSTRIKSYIDSLNGDRQNTNA